MKIAIVNQAIDRILPPIQTSVGACSYGLAHSLASNCEVMVYGISGVAGSKKLGHNFYDRGVHYRLLPESRLDRILGKLFKKYATSSLGKRLNRGMKPPPSTSNWLSPLYGRNLAKDLRLQQCDIIHFQHTSQYIPIVRALNPQAKIVLHLHAEWFPQNNPAMLVQRMRHLDWVTSVSHYITEKTRRNFPQVSDRCKTIYNGIDAKEFSVAKDYAQIKQRKIKKILYIGAVSPHKGVHILLDAFEIVAQQYAEVQLEVVGPQWSYPIEENFPMNDLALIEHLRPFYAGNYMDYLWERLSSATRGKVSFVGAIPRTELVERFYDADIFAFPSIWDEGFGLPPLESMAAGTPVVATKSGAVAETVQDGKTGFLVEKNDVLGLATAMLKLLNDENLRETMGKAGRKRALEFFTWDRSADTALQCYEGISERKTSPPLAASIQ
jgi:glycosyltransferase involved in cell wall biosynthesis